MEAGHGEGSQVFRPSKLLAVLMAGAGGLWGAVLLYLLTFRDVPLKTLLSAIFFVIFFGLSLAYYVRTSIEIDASGITYRGVIRTRRFDFDQINKVDVLPGPITVYAVRGPGGLVHFTSFFRHHRRLMELLVQRARLAPLQA
jgi:hypothetical protein